MLILRQLSLLTFVYGSLIAVTNTADALELERFPIVVPGGCHAEIRRTSVYKAFENGGTLESI